MSRPLKIFNIAILWLGCLLIGLLLGVHLAGYSINIDLDGSGNVPGSATASATPTVRAATATAVPPTATATTPPPPPTAQPTATANPPSPTAPPQALDPDGPPFRLLLDGDSFALDWSTVQQLLAAGDDGLLHVNPAALADFVAAFAAEYNRTAQRAAFRWNEATARPEVVQESYVGLLIDEDALAAALAAALEGGRGQDIAVPAQAVAPEWSSDVLPSIGDELIGAGSIYYADDDAATIQNVEQGALALDGAVALPGAIFSHDAWVYDGRYYAPSYAIVGDRTVLAPGGGLCIVSTTLFQTAFLAGLPIVERHNHAYWIAMYALDIDGETYKGLDATVGDMRFRNTTGAALRVKAWTADGWLHIQLIGSKPDWQVQVHSYAISNYQPAYSTIDYYDEPSLPSGSSEVSRNPHDGFDATITRDVLQNGAVIDTYTATSHYITTGKQVLVGSGN